LWALETPPRDEARFEIFVQHWLERLAEQPLRDLPQDIDEALREYVLPAVSHGRGTRRRPPLVESPLMECNFQSPSTLIFLTMLT